MATLDLKNIAGGEAEAWCANRLRDIDLGFELEPAPVDGDAFLLREALSNLVHNALEYSARRAASLCAPAGNGHAFLEVEDDGPGIAPAERSRVLERFYRVPGTQVPAAASASPSCARSPPVAANISIADGSLGGCRVEITFPHG